LLSSRSVVLLKLMQHLPGQKNWDLRANFSIMKFYNLHPSPARTPACTRPHAGLGGLQMMTIRGTATSGDGRDSD
jgi:hypothetical protein